MKSYERNTRRSTGWNWVNFGYLFVVTVLLLYITTGMNNVKSRDVHENDSSNVVVPIQDIIKGQPIILPQDDLRILKLIRETGIVKEPTDKAYNLTSLDKNPSMGQGQYIRQLFKDKRDGFFVECGALDGETRSNTLTLEKELGWNGLLIEGSPSNFEMLMTKNRRVWSAQACLAIKPYPHEVHFWEHFNVGKIAGASKAVKDTVAVQCFPFFTLMSYLNVTVVDYFSLDVEGNELDVLKTIPFSSIIIKTLSVEFLHVAEGTSEIVDFMETQGYVNVATIKASNDLANDIIFVHSTQMDLLDNLPPV